MNLIEMKPAVGFMLPSAGATPAPVLVAKWRGRHFALRFFFLCHSEAKRRIPASGFGTTSLLLFFASKFLLDLFPPGRSTCEPLFYRIHSDHRRRRRCGPHFHRGFDSMESAQGPPVTSDSSGN